MRRSRLAAALILATVVVGGIGASWAVGEQRRATTIDQGRKRFETSSLALTAAVAAEARRSADILAATNAFFSATSPDAAAFDDWAASERGRQPGLISLMYLRVVRPADLPAYARSVPGFELKPAGARPYYCFAQFGDVPARELLGTVPLDVDLCATTQDTTLATALSGHASVTAATDPKIPAPANVSARVKGASFFMSLPAYQGNPQTPAERDKAWRGIMAAYLDGPTLMRTALTVADSKGLGLTMRWDGVGEHAVAATIPAPNGRTFRATNRFRDDGWVLEVAGSAKAVYADAGARARAVLLLGGVITLLVAGLFTALYTSRERALRLVARRTAQLEHQALHDGLTDLPNRLLALDRAQQLLARSRRETIVPGALFLDIDDFKRVNDSYGHAAGDQLLMTVASRLRSTVRESDTIGRLGGDEFVILTDSAALANGSGAELLAQRILDVMVEPFQLADVEGPLTVSFSIGVATGERESADELLRDADLALYQAKFAGKNCFAVFQPGMHSADDDRRQLEVDLARAIERGELELDYLPTFDLEHRSVVGVEALVRWQHPTRGRLAPADFLPAAESTGLIAPIGAWVLQEACRDARSWHDGGYPIAVAVNLSSAQLHTEGVHEQVRTALANSGLPAKSLTLDIAEASILEDAATAIERVRQLKELGVRIAIDDFGTGYASLAYLQQFAVDTLKIDRSFVAAMAGSREAEALVHTLVQLGKTLGVETIAEGIEETAQLDQLRIEQCDVGQGFLFARPMPLDDVVPFLEVHGVRAQPFSA